MNELSRLCEVTGADVESVRKGMSLDPRIGAQFLQAGLGYGGSCFPKDVQGLVALGRQKSLKLGIVQATQHANEMQLSHFYEKSREMLGGDFHGKTIALWGMAFKPGTDDIRDAFMKLFFC
jgi:UDPglucose 6-dehydrogenase